MAGTDSNGKAIISVSALQHLDKERGQVFVFCGRLFPFVSELADISEFDQEKFEILELEERTHISKKTVANDTMQENSELNITSISHKADSDLGQRDDELADDLRRELERKFDELFGPLDDKDDDEEREEDIKDRTETIEENIPEKDLDDNIITLNDELGNEVFFEFLDLIEHEDEEYVVLLPINEENEIEDEVVILRVEDCEQDEENYVSVDDEKILQEVFEKFKAKFKDEFNFLEEQDIT